SRWTRPERARASSVTAAPRHACSGLWPVRGGAGCDDEGEPIGGARAGMQKVSLTATGHEQLDVARRNQAGRAAETVYRGHEHVIRQTVIALLAGQRLDEHESPGEATVHVLDGRVRLLAGEASWDGRSGDLLLVPDERHALEALEDAVVLLTVAKRV